MAREKGAHDLKIGEHLMIFEFRGSWNAADGFGKAMPAGDVDNSDGRGGQRDFEAADGGGAEIVFIEAGAPDAGARATRADDVDLFMVVDTCGHLPQGGR